MCVLPKPFQFQSQQAISKKKNKSCLFRICENLTGHYRKTKRVQNKDFQQENHARVLHSEKYKRLAKKKMVVREVNRKKRVK